MTRLPALPGTKVIKALQRAGFEVLRQKGSHVYLRHSDGRRTVVPVHKGEDLGRGILGKILRDAEMDRETFLEFL